MMLGEKVLEYEVRVMNGFWRMKERTKEAVHDFFITEDGDTNFISIVIILVIVVALAALFRGNIAKVVNNMWGNISRDAGKAITGTPGPEPVEMQELETNFQ